MKKIIFSTLYAFALVGCGGPDPKNIEDQAKFEEELRAAKTHKGRFVINSKYCDYGWGVACYDAAINASSGVYNDKKEAEKKYLEFREKACDLKYADGCRSLGDYHARNTSFADYFIDEENIDMKKAVSYYEKYYEFSNDDKKNKLAFYSLAKAYKEANMMDKFKNLYDKHCPEGPGKNQHSNCFYLMKN